MKLRTLTALTASLFLAAAVAQAQTFTGANIGTPTLSGSVVGTAPGVMTITGGGSDIWGTSDNCYYVYTTVTGQIWDAKVRVQGLVGPTVATDDGWTKCELMARVPDASGTPKGPDRFIALMTTRTNGQNDIGPQYRPNRGSECGNVGPTVDPTYPNTWLRLTRQGSLFTMYTSTNGTDWAELTRINTAATDYGFGNPFPDPLVVGIAVTGHADSDPTGGVATISDLSVTVTPSTPALTVVTPVQDASTYHGAEAYFSFAATNSAIANGSAMAFQWYKDGQAIANANTSVYAHLASLTDNGAKIYCAASLPGAATLYSTGTVTVAAATEMPGMIKYQVWPGLTRGVINSGSFSAKPNRVSAMPGFEAPSNWSANFGSRLSGYFIPATTGDYVFFISADDDADLFLSTDSNPANVRLVAQQEGWSNPRMWNTPGGGGTDRALAQKRSDMWSPDNGATLPWSLGINLQAGQKYFMMATHTEGGGGDNLGVYAKLMTDVDPIDGDPSTLTNGVVSLLTRPATTLTITADPQSVTVFEGLNASMTVAVSTDAEFTPVYQWQRNQVDIPGATAATIRFSPADIDDNGAKYRCVVTLPPTGLTATSAEATLTVQASVFITGIVKQELWGPTASDTYTRAAVEDGSAGDPTTTGFITMFDQPDFADYYAQRLSTWFVPATTGDYVFAISSDDDSDLFVSTDDDPVNKQLVAQQTSYNGTRSWSDATGQRRSDTFSPDGVNVPFASGIHMVAGTRYYIEAVHHEGSGGDSLAAYVIKIGESLPANGTESNLKGNLVGLKLPAPTTLSIAAQPQSVTAHGWDPAVFNITAASDALYPPTYQWRKNGVNIPNATTATYSFVTSASDSGSVIDCVVNLSQYGSITSAPANVTVLGDAIFTPNTLKEEYFTGAGFQTLVNNGVGAPSQVNTWTSLESRTNMADNFSRRVSGFFIPPVEGDYVFFTSSDDQSNFYISTDDQPKNKRLVAQQLNWNDPRLWTSGDFVTMRRSDQWSPDDGLTYPWSAGIHLLANTRYYIEVLMREGSGGDNLAATYKLLLDVDPVDGSAPLFTGSVIAHMAAPAPTEQPRLTIIRNGSNVQISWAPTGGHLESKAALGPGAWTQEGTQNPASLPIVGERYFRVVVP